VNADLGGSPFRDKEKALNEIMFMEKCQIERKGFISDSLNEFLSFMKI